MTKISDTWRKVLLAVLYFIIDLVSKDLDKVEELANQLEERQRELTNRVSVLDNSLFVLNNQVVERLKVRDSLMAEMAEVEYEIDMLTNESSITVKPELTDEEVVRVNL